MLRIFLLSAFLAVLSVPVMGQAKPAGGAGTWQVGAGFSFGPPDYTLTYIKGFSAYASYDIDEHSGMVVEYHNLGIITPKYLGESSVLIGARYGITRGRLHPYIKALFGVGLFQPKQQFVPAVGTSGYEVFAGGVGLEYRLSTKVNLQLGDFEYQGWPAFQPNGLTPWVTTIGVSRRF